ncbi:MAG: thioredoxin domain-containing protein [Bdellovibrio sp.]
MRKIMLIAATLLLATGCATNETQIKEVLQKNPKIIFDVIAENPEQFVEVVNRAAQAAQKKHYEKQVAEMRAEQEANLKNPKKPKLNEERRLSGDSKGKIVIVEYADFQCPACRMAAESLNRFKDKYRGQVQFYYKHMPLDFHKMAYPAALYFEALKLQSRERALKFFARVYDRQGEMSSEAFLRDTARQVGADLKKLQQDIGSEKVKQIIAEDMAEFQQFGFTGTPVILINGVVLYGAQKVEELERVAKLTGAL